MDYEILASENGWEIMIDGAQGYIVNDDEDVSVHVGSEDEVREIVSSLGESAAISYFKQDI